MAGWNTDIFETHQCRLCSEYEIIDDLVNAINERCLAINTATLDTDIILNETHGIVNLIGLKINQLIPEFINHTDSGGDWSGKVGIPEWTKSGILTFLGQYEVEINRLYVSADWAKQQYDILNLLKWIKKTYYTITNVRSGAVYSSCDINGYNGALSQWNNDIWGPDVIDLRPMEQSWNQCTNVASLTVIQNYRGKIKVYNTSGINASFLFYFMPEITAGDFYSTDGYTEGELFLGETFTENGNTENDSSFYMETPMIYTTPITGNRYGGSKLIPNPIAKFDGPNGFTYRGPDW